jgi:non-specific serine/threonine protein kinase/serine/threonine-protein kinase
MEAVERAERIADLVESALDLDVVERINFLDQQCGDDAELRAEVESLLKFQKHATDFIEAPAYQMAAETLALETGELRAGDELGGYRICSLLGEGGMGEVYLADDMQFGRTVAIKLIKRAFSRADFLRQFEQEERILAGLNHPYIARLYGGAVTPDGLPYFIMEHVEGDRLDDYCERHQLTLRERLEIFRKICSAVSYAHHRLIIHRDLKPGNIRVTAEGEPKLLDFGIAKLLDDAAAGPANETPTLATVMTPEYASPEQVRGEPMTTASDVYSLGVILYELLAGEKPYRLTNCGREEVARAVGEAGPARPSTALRESGAVTAGNHKPLRGDLDHIVMMALRKEPERRYASVGQLAEDIRRHLEARPVRARKDTWTYRSSRFIKRNKMAVAAAALIAMSLIAGLLATTWQARRAEKQRLLAERRFTEVRRLARSLVFEIHDSVADLPGSTPTRELIVQRALEYLNNLAHEAGGDASLMRELATAYVKVGNVQGNPNNSNLGDTAGALASFEKAKSITDQLLRANPNDAQARRSLGVIQEKMSDVQAARGDLAAAVANAQRSLAAFAAVATADPTSVAAQQSYAISHFKTGDVLGNPNFPNNGDRAGAQRHYEAALALLKSLPPPTAADDYKTSRLIGLVEERLGTMAELANDIAAAREHYSASTDIRLKLAREHPENTDVVRDAAIAHEKMANVQTAAGDLDAALESRQQSLAIFTRLAEADPKNVLAQQSLGISYMHLADLLGAPDGSSLGRREEAIVHYQRAAEELRKSSDPADAKSRGYLEAIEASLAKLQLSSSIDAR